MSWPDRLIVAGIAVVFAISIVGAIVAYVRQ